MRKSLFFIFTGKTVRIEPAPSLFIMSRQADDAIVRKKTTNKNVTQQMLLELLHYKGRY